MSKTLEELEQEMINAQSAYWTAAQEEAQKQYNGLIGKWLEVDTSSWRFSDDEVKQRRKYYPPKYIKVAKVRHCSEVSSGVYLLYVDAEYYAEILWNSDAYIWKENAENEDFYSNRYRIVDADYVAEQLKKVTIQLIDQTNKIIKKICQ